MKGRVFDSDTGRAVAGALVKSASGEDQTSDEKGNFDLPLQKGGDALEIQKDSYTAKTQDAPVAGGYVEVFLKGEDRVLEFDAEKGTKVKLPSGASIEFPPSTVVDKQGSRVKGLVKLHLSDVDGRDLKQSLSLPSQAKAKATDGKLGSVAVSRALSISVRDMAGKELTVDPKGKVVAELPVHEPGAKSEGRGFSYDESLKQWVEEEPVVRTLNDDGATVYRKNVRHLSWHGYGTYFETLTCLRVCVEDAAKSAVSGAQIWAVGSSFPGVATFFTDDGGCASQDVPASQTVQLVAHTADGTSSTKLYTTADMALRAADAPERCPLAATLTLRSAAPSSCPAGFEDCGGICVDTETHPLHCGGCGQRCGGEAGRERICVAGECGCPAGTSSCGAGAAAACADLTSDPAHCGSCDVRCAGDQVCSGGMCVGAGACPEALTRCGSECVDLKTNLGHCGACGVACGSEQVCLGKCVAPTSSTLCTANTQIVCDDGQYCNGVEVCNPNASQAASNGCVAGPAPCAQALCDEAQNSCRAADTCTPSSYATKPNRCAAAVSACLSSATESSSFVLSNLILCGATDQTAASGLDELASAYDCESCLRNDMMLCAARYGCADQAKALDCCVQKTACTGQGCIAQQCPSETMALDQCLSQQAAGSRCYDFITSTQCVAAAPPPVITSFSGPAQACKGSTILLSYNFTGGTGLILPAELLLNPGMGQQQTVLNATTMYTLSVSNGSGTPATAQTTVTAIDGPTVSPNVPATAAHGQTNLVVNVPQQSGVTYAWSIVSGDASIVNGQNTSQAILSIGPTGSSVTVGLTVTSTQTGCATSVQRVIKIPCAAPLPISFDRSAAPNTKQFTPGNMDTRPPAFSSSGVIWAPYLTQKPASGNHDANFSRVVAGAYSAPANSPATFNQSAATAYYVKVGTDDSGNAVFVWTESSDTTNFFVKLQAYKVGTGWLNVQTVGTSQNNNADAPVVMSMNPTTGQVVIAWASNPYPNGVPHVRSYSLATDSLGTDTPLQASNTSTYAPQFYGLSLATDAQLNGFVTWFEYDGTNTKLNAVHLSAAQPDLNGQGAVDVKALASSATAGDQISSQSMVWQTAAYEVKTVAGSPSGNFAVLWRNYTYDPQTQIGTGTLSARRYLNGVWGPRELVVSRPAASFSNIDFAIDNNGDMILAARCHNPGDDIFAYGLHGAAWAPFQVLGGGDLSTLPYVALEPSTGQGAVTFRDASRPSPYPLVASRYDPVTHQLSPSFVVDNPSQSTSDSGRPFIAPNGTLSVVFAQVSTQPPPSGDSAYLYLTTCP